MEFLVDIQANGKPNVILMTIDGVRPQEVYEGVQRPGRSRLRRGTELLLQLKKAVKDGNPYLRPDQDRRFSHLNIRPTLESLLGVRS